MEQAFLRDYQAEPGPGPQDHLSARRHADEVQGSQGVRPVAASRSPARTAYGSSRFGEGCLLARRLVEVGVTFVEVTLGGWDTHQDNFDRVKNLSSQVDPAMSALINDLKERGLLDNTLVIWMGEFGRTPNINARGAKPGRDHYPRAWTSVLAGGGIKGGQVIGKTDKEGAVVTDRPISALDFLATVCKLLGINSKKTEPRPGGRPIRIVDKGAKPIEQLL